MYKRRKFKSTDEGLSFFVGYNLGMFQRFNFKLKPKDNQYSKNTSSDYSDRILFGYVLRVNFKLKSKGNHDDGYRHRPTEEIN